MTSRRRSITFGIGIAAGVTLAMCPTAANADAPGPIATATSTLTLPGGSIDWTLLGMSENDRQALVGYSTDSGYATAVVDLASASVTVNFPTKDMHRTPVTTTDGARIMVSSRWLQSFDTTGALAAEAKDLTAISNIVVGPLGRQVYVIDQWNGRALALDPQSLQRIWAMPVCPRDFRSITPDDPESPGPTTGLAITPDGSTLIVSCPGDGLQFLSSKTGKMIGAVPTVRGTVPVAISSDGASAYLAHDTKIFAVDVKRHALRASASLYSSSDGKRSEISGTWTPSISADGKRLFVAWDCIGVLKSVNTKTLRGVSIPVAGKVRWGAIAVATDPVLTNAYAISTTNVVTVNTKTSAVRGIDPAAPAKSAAEHVVAAAATAVVSWEASSVTSPNQVGITILTMTRP